MIDWSSKHDIWIKNPDGTYQPMDEPYFRNKVIMEGVWLIQSDGDAAYLVEGDNEAIMIDTGCGCGNVREYCQTLTDKPVKYVINTHEHFGHTANNCYFEKAYMSQITSELATIPYPSFKGVDFPRDYPKQIVKEGDIIDLGNCELEIIEMCDHAKGSILILDKKHKILFAGDEITRQIKYLKNSVEYNYNCFKKLEEKNEYIQDVWTGYYDHFGYEVIDAYLKTLKHILNHHFGVESDNYTMPVAKQEYKDGHIVYTRFKARIADKNHTTLQDEDLFAMGQFGVRIVYSRSKVYENK